MATSEDYNLGYSPINDLTDPNINLWVSDQINSFASTKTISSPVAGQTQLNITKQFSVPVLRALGHIDDGQMQTSSESTNVEDVQTYATSRGITKTVLTAATSLNGFCQDKTEAALTRDYLTDVTSDNQRWNISGTLVEMDWNTLNCLDGTATVMTVGLTPELVTVNNIENSLTHVTYSDSTYASYFITGAGWTNIIITSRIFAASYVSNFEAIEDRMIKAVNNMFGFRHEDIFESIDEIEDGDSNVADMLLTYAIPLSIAKEKMPKLAEYLELFYNGNTITFTADNTTYSYYPNPFAGETDNKYAISINGKNYFDAADPRDDGQIDIPLIVPLSFVDTLNIREKYEFKRWCLTFFSNIKTTTKLKWYQTGIFRAIAFVVALLVAYFTGPQALFAFFSSTMLSLIVDNPLISAIVSLINFDFSGLANVTMDLVLDQLTSVLTAVASVSDVYFTMASADIAKQIKSVNESIEDTAEEHEEEFGGAQPLYIPSIDGHDNYMSIANGDVLYDVYDSLYDTDKFYKLPGMPV